MSSTKAEVSTPEGQTFHLQISTIYRRQQPAGRIIVLHNITERKLAEEEREKLIDDLNAYAHTVAHDLKNPIGLINSSVQFIDLKFKPEVSEPFAERLNVIEQTSRKMVNIVDELLVLASVRNQDTIEKSVLDMPAILDSVLKRLEPIIEEAGARILHPENWQPGLGYGPWVEEIWANYISNALKYGGQPPVIEVGSERASSGMVRFWVKDNGNGMTAQEREKLFMQFTRLPQHLKAEGQGLGLSIVKRIAEKLDGDVGVESEIGQGSRFYFTLPLALQLEKERR
jgi:signal transduction histidine kinase